MKVLYGIQLNGNGHITRSIKIINTLIEEGFEVDIITSGRNSQLNLPFEVKYDLDGISFVYNKTGGINWFKTITKLNIRKFLSDISIDTSSYDIIISDFEPISAWSAIKNKKMSIGIGNQYSFNSNKINRPFFKDIFSETFIKYFAPCKHYIGINYERYEDFITLPIIDDCYIDKKVSDNNFYLVYLPSMSKSFISKHMNEYGKGLWKVYSKDVIEDEVDGVIEFKKMYKESFSQDFLNCSGIVTASGFSTTSEALILGKKLWSMPTRGQYEQTCNALSLKEMGVFTKCLNKSNIEDWISNYNSIEYDWIDPSLYIVNKIKEYYAEKN